jgi:hypothetical protein
VLRVWSRKRAAHFSKSGFLERQGHKNIFFTMFLGFGVLRVLSRWVRKGRGRPEQSHWDQSVWCVGGFIGHDMRRGRLKPPLRWVSIVRFRPQPWTMAPIDRNGRTSDGKAEIIDPIRSPIHLRWSIIRVVL